MLVELHIEKGYCKITKQAGDKRYTRGYALPESTFLCHVKRELQRQGHDVIKKRMWRDGHMVNDLQQYIRTRVFTVDDGWAVYNDSWAIQDAGMVFNGLKAGESLQLAVIR